MKAPLRIAIVADGDPEQRSTNSGVAAGLLSGLRRDPRVDVVATVDSTPPLAIRLFTAAVAIISAPRYWRSTFRKGTLARWARSRRRDQLLRSHQVDVVIHVRNTYAPYADAAYVNFVDNVASLSQREWEPWSLPRREYVRRFGAEQRQFRMSVATYTAGRHVRAEISKEYSLPLDRVVAVGGGLNPVPQSGVPRQEGRVLFVGYDFERKGGDVLLRAFSKVTVPNAELVIVGPEARPSADPRVRWVGRLSDRQELADLYASAAVFVLPALFEPYGLVIAEAMNSGLPCVVSDANELPRLVEDEVSGIVVPRGDDQSLAVALERLLGDPCLRVRLGDAAQRSIATEGLTWRDVASRMIADIGPRVGN